MKDYKVKWTYPQPRTGLVGEWDKFIGPGATTAEVLISLIPALLAAALLGVYASLQSLSWTFWQYLVGMVLAFDITGGVATNATSAAKRWYHREGQTFASHYGFLSLHVFHILLVAWLFREWDWVYLLAMSGYLLVSGLLVLIVPLYLQRSIALLLVCGAITLSFYLFSPAPGMAWFIPFLFLKLIASHLTFEQPYAKT